MSKFILSLCVLLLASLPLTQTFAVNGVAAHTQIESPIEGLTTAEIINTPVKNLDETLGRKLTSKEKSTARKIKRLNKRLRGPKNPDGTETTAIVAFVTGVGGLVFLFIPPISIIGLIACIVGIVFGAISLKKFKTGRNIGGGKGLGLAGMICGIVGVALILIAILLVASLRFV